jgi:hypothetical protein
MKTLASHQTSPTLHNPNDLNSQIVVTAEDEPGSGGAHHKYRLALPGNNAQPAPECVIVFHHIVPGQPVPEEPTGFSNEALLAVLIDRMEGFQGGQYACEENRLVLEHLRLAMKGMHVRTRRRQQQGVEGKLAQHDSNDAVGGGTIATPGNGEIAKLSTDAAGRIIKGLEDVSIGDESIKRATLATTWKAWDAVLSAVKKLDSPLTQEELNVLATVPVSNAATSGFTEFKQAVQSQKLVA